MFENNFAVINLVLAKARREFEEEICSRCLRTIYYIEIQDSDGLLQFKQKEHQAIHCTIYSHESGQITLYFKDLSIEELQYILNGLIKCIDRKGYRGLVNLLKSMQNNEACLNFLIDCSKY